jgi:anthranilate synthase component 1
MLESAPGPQRLAEYTFIGFEPLAVLTLRDGRLYLDGESVAASVHPLEELRALLSAMARPKWTEFKYLGGLVGYISYDFVRYLERVPEPLGERIFPDFEFGLFLDGVIFDHTSSRAFYFTHGEDRSEWLNETKTLSERTLRRRAFSCETPVCAQTEDDFTQSVAAARDRISAGEIYQLVLSRRLSGRYQGDLFEVYRALRQINPSPYMYFLDLGPRLTGSNSKPVVNKRSPALQTALIAGSSPEMLVAMQGRTVTTFPIAGTRPLGRTEAERRAYAQELLSDEKERAEHNMLVDLARNDIGRISEYGSVRVPDYMRIERFSHVQHIVSRVEGRLRSEYDALDALTSLFPAGTVSGAPKIRAMELIAQLEPCPRGPYAGAVGYFSLNGNMDTAIAIRTIVADSERLYLQAGAGIVSDSVPERELAETEHKLEALKKALEGGSDESSLDR